MSRPSKAFAALVIAAFLFGATFVVVKSALEDIGPHGFVAWRFALGAVALGAFALPRGKELWRDGALAGTALFAGYAFQTAGLVSTSASNSALITGLYVVFTPFLAAGYERRPPRVAVVVGALAAFAGVYLLTGTEGITLAAGDLLTLGCALSFAIHIVMLSVMAPRHRVVPFTTAQLAVTALLAFGLSMAVEGPALPSPSVWGALAVTGLAVTVGAFLLQVWAQTVVAPAAAAVVLAGEPVFGVATAWIVLGERLSGIGLAGAGLIVVAIYLVVTRQASDASRRAEAVTPAH